MVLHNLSVFSFTGSAPAVPHLRDDKSDLQRNATNVDFQLQALFLSRKDGVMGLKVCRCVLSSGLRGKDDGVFRSPLFVIGSLQSAIRSPFEVASGFAYVRKPFRILECLAHAVTQHHFVFQFIQPMSVYELRPSFLFISEYASIATRSW